MTQGYYFLSYPHWACHTDYSLSLTYLSAAIISFLFFFTFRQNNYNAHTLHSEVLLSGHSHSLLTSAFQIVHICF